ncbi:o-succinylbenzoate synthase [Brevibacillus fulvus]|uniref:o-succinylbenzoate synthase n=1 Tax=Brevibacillus fulvus TaxID=1125967 RepID=A0A939BTE8_9BACL|nr:o-succinylbenzoate synthase [Brevibacillus fulvus]MBM7591752.1 O-succinylbenzoate synthase [Brevibacillus fulvus]
MKVEKIVLRKMSMQLKAPFRTSFGTQLQKQFIVSEVHTKEHIGYGECVAMTVPLYSEESVGGAWHVMEEFLIPLLFEQSELRHPDEVTACLAPIRRNNMAKAALEGAYWDLFAKQNDVPLAKALGGNKTAIEVGVSIGIEENIDDLYRLVEQYLQQGYRRMKIKIKPGKDVQVIAGLRQRFGNIPMMADANSAYTLEDIDLLKELDDFGLMMIEQPLAHDDIIDHAQLQKQLKTPICLDESIHSVEDARHAIELGSTKVINIKIGRVGGLTESKKIHDLCQKHGIPVWCGGMLESGIGRAHNIAITSLPNFTLPGDTAGSSRYWMEDIIKPEVTVSHDGLIHIPAEAGIGYEPVPELLDKYTIQKQEFIR